MNAPDVKEIVEEWLEGEGYEGLYNEAECGCRLCDLAPCGEMSQNCEAAFLFDCSRCAKRPSCDLADEEQPWLMSTSKDFCTPDYTVTAPVAACVAENAALPACAPLTAGEGVYVEAGEWIIPLAMAAKLFGGGPIEVAEAVYEIDPARSDDEKATVVKTVCQNTAKNEAGAMAYPNVETALRDVREGLLQLGA